MKDRQDSWKIFHGIIGILIGWNVACAPVPQSTSSPLLPHKKSEPSSPQIHVMRSGETLTQIARNFEVSVQELRDLNQIADPTNLPIGTALVIPSKKSEPSITASVVEPDPLSSIVFRWPVDLPEISSPFGSRNSRHHDGVDLRAPQGTLIYAAAGGIIKVSGWISGYGNVVIIQHTPEISTLYGHNKINLVKLGDAVQKGQAIAQVGRTGNATGNHVHFEIRMQNNPIDPQKYLPPLPSDKPFNIASN